MVTEVVDVDTEHDRGRLGRGDRREHVHQLGLAVVAAVDVVDRYAARAISSVATAVQRRPHSPASAAAVVVLGAGERRRHRRDGVHRGRPSVRWATAARNAESAPPLNATTTGASADELAAQDVELLVEVLERGDHGSSVPRAFRTPPPIPGEGARNGPVMEVGVLASVLRSHAVRPTARSTDASGAHLVFGCGHRTLSVRVSGLDQPE